MAMCSSHTPDSTWGMPTTPGPTAPGELITDADAEVGSIPTERLEAEILSCAAHLAAATCRFLLLVAEHDRRGAWESWECRSAAHWLNWKCGISMGTAREHVRVARRLRDMPLVRAEFARGAVSYSKVRALSRVSTPTIEAGLLSIALHSTASQLDVACGKLRRVQENAHCDDALDDAERDARRRMYLTLDDDASGTGVGRFRLPGDDMEILQRALATAASDIAARDELATNAAALVELARAYLANPRTGPGPQPEIVVHVDVAGLAALSSDDIDCVDPGERDSDRRAPSETPTTGGPPRAERGTSGPSPRADVPAGTSPALRNAEWPIRSAMGRHLSRALLTRLACDAGVRAVADLPDGTRLDMGRHSRTPTTQQRRALLARDVHCRFPGCDTRRNLHAHHIERWSDGGRTDCENLILLCRMHHHAVHDRDWVLTGTAVDPAFLRPDGAPVRQQDQRVDGRYEDLVAAARQVAAVHGHIDLEVDNPGGIWEGGHIDWDWFFAGCVQGTPPALHPSTPPVADVAIERSATGGTAVPGTVTGPTATGTTATGPTATGTTATGTTATGPTATRPTATRPTATGGAAAA